MTEPSKLTFATISNLVPFQAGGAQWKTKMCTWDPFWSNILVYCSLLADCG